MPEKTVDQLLADMERNKLEIRDDFLSMNFYSRRGEVRKETLGIVIHWPQDPGATAQNVRDYFESLKDSGAAFGSTQYAVGLDGEVIRMMGDDEVAFHVGSEKPDPKSGKIYTDYTRRKFTAYSTNPQNPNFCTIGMEVCHPDSTGKFTDAGFHSAAKLAARLIRKYNLGIEDVCRHWDIVGDKECPLYYVRNNQAWDGFLLTVHSYI